jgi:hypothetical protein
MNRKLGQVIKAALIALPLALPGVALAQSAGSPPTSNGTYDNTDKLNAPADKANAPQPESNTGVTPSDTTEKTPPAGSLDTSGTAKDSDKSLGGDINKAPEKMDSDSTTTTTKTTKTHKQSGKSDLDTPPPTSSDVK